MGPLRQREGALPARSWLEIRRAAARVQIRLISVAVARERSSERGCCCALALSDPTALRRRLCAVNTASRGDSVLPRYCWGWRTGHEFGSLDGVSLLLPVDV